MKDKTKVKRVPKRGHYDSETIHNILDKDFLCHVGFIHEGYPVVIPTLYGRDGDKLYIHGSMASRMMKDLEKGIELSLSVTMVNGLVLARSAFHHSVNYESVVLFGTATLVDDENEKMKALEIITDHVLRNRWKEARIPNQKELKGTMVLSIPLDTASAKIRTGGPIDDKEDMDLGIWAGTIPIHKRYGSPIKDELMDPDIPTPESVKAII